MLFINAAHHSSSYITGFGIVLTMLIFISILSIAAIGGLFSERSGVFNIAINGMMIIGALSYAVISSHVKGSQYNQIWIMLAAGLITGLFALLHAVACIKFKANQIISGTALNLLAPGLALFWITSIEKKAIIISPYSSLSLNGTYNNFWHLINFPLILSVLILIGGWVLLYKTPFGFKLRACGENPHALATVGINVNRIKYIALFISGFLSGIAGGIYVQFTSEFSGLIAGLGFIALAILIFGRWRIHTVFISAIFFGALQGFALNKGVLGSTSHDSIWYKIASANENLFLILPFAISIIALIFTSYKAYAPRAAGQFYDKSKR